MGKVTKERLGDAKNKVFDLCQNMVASQPHT